MTPFALDYLAAALLGGLVGAGELSSRYRDAPGRATLRWTQTLVAGIGAMALFRSSLFTVRAGDRDIAVGPGSFLQIFRDGADRAVDRVRAQARGDIVAKLMTGLSYGKAFEGLPTYCLALMQNVPEDEKIRLAQSLDALDKDESIGESIKVRILGLHLMNVVGPNVLNGAVNSLRDELAAGE